jgi:hypothetical protein
MGGGHDRQDARRQPRQRAGAVGADLRKLSIERLAPSTVAGVVETADLRCRCDHSLRET